MWNHPDQPYQDLPPLPPKIAVETPRVLKATIAASRALARLDGVDERLPDPEVLIGLIPLMEAQASSEIENIVTTNDELFKAANQVLSDVTPQVKEAMRYRGALLAGCHALETHPLTLRTALAVCSHLHGHDVGIRDHHETYIGGTRNSERIYTPPEGKQVILDHLAARERFLHTDHGLDPLVVMALAHYQFEAIHPFTDGNGRTGRILNLLILMHTGVLRRPILYLSGHIMRHKGRYYDLLNAVTRQDAWEPWILFMLSGIESTAKWTLQLVETTERLREHMESEIRQHHPKLPAVSLTRLLFANPYLRIGTVVEAGLAQRQTAARWLNLIADSGLIVKGRSGRQVLFVNRQLLDALFTTALPS
ncbi:MAG: Fic/DOC family N-terminal domain-containing protein [Bowdeniella nasicola]|nr:Fic/DOC family N-terminal domain-containing protein [Bowdeniella nasicola]